METIKVQLDLPKNPQDVIEYLETCCLCGGKLRFSHRTDYMSLIVHEETVCPECGIKNKPVTHRLQ